MFYRLTSPWAFRGWSKTPFAVQALEGEHRYDLPRFFRKEPFLDLLHCNGEDPIDLARMSEEGRQAVEALLADGILEQSETPLGSPESRQRYRIFDARFIGTAHWSITGKCNFNCRHCMVSAPEAHHPQLPLSDCLRIVDEIASCGIARVDITGGEPLVRNDFEEIVSALSEKGIGIGVLFTNAALLDEQTIRTLADHHQYPGIQLSLDGLGHHDWLRGVAGAESQVDAALRLLQQQGVPVSVAMCIHRGNKDSLRDTVNYLAGYDVKMLRVNAPLELGSWKEYSTEYALSDDEVWDTYRAYLPQYFADGAPLTLDLEGFFHCEKGSTDYAVPYVHKDLPTDDLGRLPYCESLTHSIFIGPDGRTAPCMAFSNTVLGEKFPNVLEESLSQITKQGLYFDVSQATVGDLVDRNPACAECPHLMKCLGGCMVEDVTDDGDYLVPDSRCCHFFKHIGEQAVRDAADAAIAAAGLL